MKFLLALLVAVCFVGVYSDEATNVSSADELECAKQNHVDAEDMAHKRSSPDHVPTKDEMCFGACLFKKSGLMGDDGKFTEEFTKKKELNALCPVEYGADACETAGKLMKCLAQHKNELEKKKAT